MLSIARLPLRRRPVATRRGAGRISLVLAALASLGSAAGTDFQESDEQPPPRATKLLGAVEHPHDERRAGFGYAVASVGDWNGDGRADVAVSAPWIGESEPGLVRVVSGADGSTLFEFVGDEPGDEFGSALVGGRDLDRDGFPDLVIGARSASGGGVQRGEVRCISGRTQRAIGRRIVGAEDRALAGSALALCDDMDGDGRAELAVGSPGEAQALGLVRVHSGLDFSVLHTFRGQRQGDLFGAAVASVGDLDGDGRGDLVIGAPNEGRTQPEAGAVRVYSGLQGRLTATRRGDQAYARLGSRVAGLGDVTGDGRAEWVAAAPTLEVGPDPDVGRVIVFNGRDASVLHTFEGGSAGEFYGRGLDAGADVNGDGWPDLLIGAPYARSDEEPDGDRVGAVELRSGPTGERLQRFEGERAGRLLGWSVALLVDGERADGAAFGAPGRQETPPRTKSREAYPGRVRIHEVGDAEHRRSGR